MNSLVIVLIAIAAFVVAYIGYGGWLCKKWGIDNKRETPAHAKEDGVDYVPASKGVVLGHHFASIAGAGPITGPIAAAMFGWVPVLLWIIIGSIFFGGVHDFGALVASIRHDGKSIGEIIEKNIGSRGKRLFALFAWLTLILVVAAFLNIVAATFASTPQAATASVLFMGVAILFGFGVYRRGLNLAVSSIIGVALLGGCIYLGMLFPLTLSAQVWMWILLAYIFVASVTPVWILLQPRDYLNSFLLFAMIGGAVIGLLFARPHMNGDFVPAFAGFNVKGSFMFPILFVTVACGAISGFHSLVGSGTSSKMVDQEKDAKMIGYGGMLIEGVLAVIALVAIGAVGMQEGGAIPTFSVGVATFMSSFGLSMDVGVPFIALAISAFALTSLDTATRLARFIFQEFWSMEGKKEEEKPVKKVLSNMYVATAISVAIGGFLGFSDWRTIWPIFGSANQLLAALALLAIGAWLAKSGRNNIMVKIPMIFMFLVTLTALVFVAKNNLAAGNYILVGFAVALFILALVLIKESYKVLFTKQEVEPVSEAV
ncbi:MAG: carbon starvation protein A [Spirochaetales bacterium]|nr:carbon starvation protein A [Spirochaetales bacterium]